MDDGESKDDLQTLLNSAHWIDLNANDFFYLACADLVRTEYLDELGDMVRKFGTNGVLAFMTHSRGQDPVWKYKPDAKYVEALEYIRDTHPEVYKTDLTVYEDTSFEYGKGPLAKFFAGLVSDRLYNIKELREVIVQERSKKLAEVPTELEVSDIIAWGARNYYIEQTDEGFKIVRSMWEEVKK